MPCPVNPAWLCPLICLPCPAIPCPAVPCPILLGPVSHHPVLLCSVVTILLCKPHLHCASSWLALPCCTLPDAALLMPVTFCSVCADSTASMFPVCHGSVLIVVPVVALLCLQFVDGAAYCVDMMLAGVGRCGVCGRLQLCGCS